MYNYNNEDRSKEERLIDWCLTFNSDKDRTHTRIESRVTQTLRSIWMWERFKPTHSTKGNSQYHK